MNIPKRPKNALNPVFPSGLGIKTIMSLNMSLSLTIFIQFYGLIKSVLNHSHQAKTVGSNTLQ